MKIFLLRSIPVFRVTFLQPALGLSPIWKAHSGQRHKHCICRATSSLPAANHPGKGTARRFLSFPEFSPKRLNPHGIAHLPPPVVGTCPPGLLKALIPPASLSAPAVPHPVTEPRAAQTRANLPPPLCFTPGCVRRSWHNFALELETNATIPFQCQ